MRVERLLQFGPIAAIFTFALALRLWRLNLPSGYIFDEVYYAKNAASLITTGVELNDQGESEFVVHPPLGKWLIGIGIRIFGNNEFGWRFSAAIFGSFAVLLIYLIVKKLFTSEFLSITAALLFALDGLNLVMSRVALLDIFLMLFILLAFYFLLLNNFGLITANETSCPGTGSCGFNSKAPVSSAARIKVPQNSRVQQDNA